MKLYKLILWSALLSLLFMSPLPALSQEQPIQVNLYYNNHSVKGNVFLVNSIPYLSIDSIYNTFPGIVLQDTGSGSYRVNGRAVNTYYYFNHLYLDIAQLADALSLHPSYFRDRLEIVFVDKKQHQETVNIPVEPPVKMEVLKKVQAVSSEPVNSVSCLYRLGLSNVSAKLLTLHYYNFMLIGHSGSRYVSVNNMKYEVVIGDGGPLNTVMLGPGQKRTVDVNFNLPPGDTPRYLVIFEDNMVEGYVKF
jgi:hypothetical protein